MSQQIRADKQLIITAIGAGSAALTGVILGLIEAFTGFALYSLMFWFIIPMGAIFAGAGATSGYYYGAKHFHQKPAGGIVINMILASISTYLLVHYVPYYLMEVDGNRVKDAISFWSYLDLSIRHTSLSLRAGSSTGELGSVFGYIYALIQLIGFSIGGLAVFGWLLDAPFCDICEKYPKKTSTQNRYMREEDALSEKIKTFVTKLNEKRYVEALRFHADQMGDPKGTDHHLRTRITMHKCKGCGINHLDFETSRWEQKSWKDIDEARTRMWFNPKLDSTS